MHPPGRGGGVGKWDACNPKIDTSLVFCVHLYLWWVIDNVFPIKILLFPAESADSVQKSSKNVRCDTYMVPTACCVKFNVEMCILHALMT